MFFYSLWLFVCIVYHVAPGRKFMIENMVADNFLSIAFLVAMLAKTDFSYRMGPTCLPNHDNAITTFWVWFVVFAILGFLLQAMSMAYCI
jgi:hypothetical protein